MFHPIVYLTIGTFSTSAIWFAGGVPPLTLSFSYGEVTVTLEDVANQVLLPILGDVDPGALELSPEEEAVGAELKKRMSGNAKLSY